MDIYLTEADAQDSLTDETVIRYLYTKYKQGYWKNGKNSLKETMSDMIAEESTYIYEHVPRAAVEYMQIDKYYDIVKDDSGGLVPTDRTIQKEQELKELRDVVYYGAKNAHLSSEEFGIDPLESAERGVLFLIDFAIEHGCGVTSVD